MEEYFQETNDMQCNSGCRMQRRHEDIVHGGLINNEIERRLKRIRLSPLMTFPLAVFLKNLR